LRGLKPNIDLIGFIGMTDVMPQKETRLEAQQTEPHGDLWFPAHFAKHAKRTGHGTVSLIGGSASPVDD
jgi:hypothetical protein